MAGVTFRQVSKRFGVVSVIEGMDLEVRDGEFMVLVGPSGCGKTTALRMIAGLEEVSGGEVRIGDRVVNDVPPKDRNIAMVFQNYALYPHMTVRENLEFGLRLRRMPRAEMSALVDEASTILGIGPLMDRRPKELSGGQRQRVAVGRAITRKPAVFLFDEPLSNLDAKLRVQMRAEITKLQKSLGTTTVYVTHDQVEAMTMGTRITVMKDGRIQQVGTPLEVYERPVNVFVAGFIGTPPMSFAKARVDGGGTRLVAGGFDFRLPAALRGEVQGMDGRGVLVGIRPENVSDGSRPARGETGRISVVVEALEPLGSEALVHVRAGEDLLLAKVDSHHAPALDSTVELGVELDALHLFDAATERRLGGSSRPVR